MSPEDEDRIYRVFFGPLGALPHEMTDISAYVKNPTFTFDPKEATPVTNPFIKTENETTTEVTNNVTGKNLLAGDVIVGADFGNGDPIRLTVLANYDQYGHSRLLHTKELGNISVEDTKKFTVERSTTRKVETRLPIPNGTIVRSTYDGTTYFRTAAGWIDSYGAFFPHHDLDGRVYEGTVEVP